MSTGELYSSMRFNVQMQEIIDGIQQVRGGLLFVSLLLIVIIVQLGLLLARKQK